MAATEPRILRPGRDDPRAETGTLRHGEVEVWLLEPSAERAARLGAALAPDELERRDRLKDGAARLRFADSRGSLRAILAGHLGAAPAELAFSYGPHGRPGLAAEQRGELDFSVAHSAGLIAIAVAAGLAVGIDVEERRPRARVERLADRILAASERDGFRRLDPDRLQAAFIDLWCMKEACSKLVGRGLTLPMCAIAIDDPSAAATSATVGDGTRCAVRRLPVGGRYGGALASTEIEPLTTL